jgi:hypothetical protein
MRFVRRVPCFPKRPALAQEIPALIEINLEGRQPPALGGVRRSSVE